MISATAVLSLATGIATAGEAQATTYWRSIKFVHAGGQCLTIQAKASTSKGKRELIKKCNNGTSQAWRLVVGTYKGTQVTQISPAGDTGKCLDGAKSEKTGSEWYLHAVKCSSSTTQKWKYVRGDTQALWGAQNYKTGLCIAPRKKSQASGTWVVTTKCNGNNSSRQMLQSA
ncbi:RICIN domain-containing protein [Streptomyces sp. W16]|uniref:RICIN domain-containing protein n=1 Tax=Streptomyces sp. W16 TaxID=3076631 RepID=UPI00295BA501|nr:RICIN domain-containing protein [Streptomyces sp. W16]MDV9172525.1 RICIN domain-containing protein [Streptomyces sp. W16]